MAGFTLLFKTKHITYGHNMLLGTDQDGGEIAVGWGQVDSPTGPAEFNFADGTIDNTAFNQSGDLLIGVAVIKDPWEPVHRFVLKIEGDQTAMETRAVELEGYRPLKFAHSSRQYDAGSNTTTFYWQLNQSGIHWQNQQQRSFNLFTEVS